jgi:hypothetical protein
MTTKNELQNAVAQAKARLAWIEARGINNQWQQQTYESAVHELESAEKRLAKATRND